MLIGNKTDLVVGNPERRQVPHTEASVFAQEHGIMHMETSAQSGEFVPEAFLRVAKTTLQRLQLANQSGNNGKSGNNNNSRNNLLVGGSSRNNDGQNNNGDNDDLEAGNSPVRLTERSGANGNNSGDGADGSANSMCAKC